MKILVATDAWHPQVNGVVHTLECLQGEIARLGHEMVILGPDRFRTVPLPTYPGIRLALSTRRAVQHHIEEAAPDRIHIATEGPIGWAVRRYCLRWARPFTTSYHTRFPEYVAARLPISVAPTYRLLQRFHAPSCAVMAPTPSMCAELEARGFSNVVLWSRGVDHDLFHPRSPCLDFPAPRFLYVGRVAVEKNLEAFLSLDLPGSKIVVGDGPQLKTLAARYRDVHFLGVRCGEALARLYASADVFVFPSKTDTFGLVLLEALASGTPVAAYPVTGPRDIIGDTPVGVLSDDLREAALGALHMSRAACRDRALEFSWVRCARTFLDHAEKEYF